jgi:hypothetical protein
MKPRLITAVIAFFSITSAQGQSFEPLEFNGPGSESFSHYSWADFNADGVFDILDIDFYSKATLHISEPGGFSATPIEFTNVYFEEARYAFNDYDADGDLDILTIKQSSIVILNYDPATGFGLINTGISYTDVEAGKLFWRDLNGDLVPDIIHGRKVFVNRDGVYSASGSILPEYLSNMMLSDLNGDGLADIVAGGYESYEGTQVTVYLNLGDGQFQQTGTTLSRPKLRSKTLAVIDADADSDPDIFAFDEFGRGWVFNNNFSETGKMTFTDNQILYDTYVSQTAAGDVNSDGLADVVAVGYQTLKVLINTSTSTAFSFKTESYELASDLDIHNFDIVDIDGDDDNDIHIKGYSSANWIQDLMFEKKGTPAGSGPAAPANPVSVVGKHVRLSWDSVPGTLYNIAVKKDDVRYNPAITSTTGKLIFTDDTYLIQSGSTLLRGLPAGTYEWKVQAVDASGRASAFSVPATFVVNAGPSALVADAIDLTAVELCWSYGGAGNPAFKIFRRILPEASVEIAEVADGITCFTDNSVPANTTAEYFVVAVEGSMYSAPSNTVRHHSTVFVETPFGSSDPNIIAARCFPADFDLDGDYDLEFIGRIHHSDNNILLKNNGAGIFTADTAMLIVGGIKIPYTEMVGPRDIDNDGDLDIVAITGSDYHWAKVTVFINNNGKFVKGFETPVYLEISQLAVEDMNSDGRPDLLFSNTIGNSTGDPKQYQLLYQTPDGKFKDSNIILADPLSSSLMYFRCADLNNDGFVDILLQSANKQYADIMVNNSGLSFTKIPSTLPNTYNMGVADYTGDGIIDVAVLGNEGLNIYFGSGAFTWKDPKVILIDYISNAPTFTHADIDLNGYQDLLITDGYNARLVLNNGNGSFKRSDIHMQGNWGTYISITDFENDGDIDIVKTGNDGQHQGLNYFYTNQLADVDVVNTPPSAPDMLDATFTSGNAVFTWTSASDDRTPSTHLTYNLWVADAKGKIWFSPETNASGNFRLRLAPGNCGHSTTKQLNDLPAGTYKVRVQAIDASFAVSPWSDEVQLTIDEGASDLTVERILLNKIKLSWSGSPYEETRVIVQRKTPLTIWEEIAELAAGTTTYTDADLAFNTLYQYRIVEATAEQRTAASNIAEWNTYMWQIQDTDIANLYGSMDIADFTGDGKMDMVLNGGMIYNGYTEDITRATFENTGGAWTKSNITPSDLSHTAQISFTDLNDDFQPDIYQQGYVWGAGYKTEAFLNKGDKSFAATSNVFTTGAYFLDGYFDVDMDNDLDVVAREPNSYPAVFYTFQNNGNGNYSPITPATCYSCKPVAAVADFDKDGDEDVISLIGSTYQLYLNTPNGLVATSTSFSAYETKLVVTDYNNDGLPDIALLTSSFYHVAKVYKNLGLQAGGSVAFSALPLNLSSGEQSLLSADFNHDGRTDIAVLSPNISVLLNMGADAFQQYTVPNYRLSLHTAGTIDFDNDGDLDIYISGYHTKDFSEQGRKAKILLNQTIVSGKGVSNAPPNAPSNLSSTQDSLGLHLSWTPQGDDHTQPEGLTYDVVLTRDGKNITKGDHNPATGQRVRLTPGKSTGIMTLSNLLVGSYTWRVQAVDGSFAASGLSEAGTFTFLPSPPVISDTVIYRCGRSITLTAKGTGIKWFKDQGLTEQIASGEFHPQESQTVYVAQTIDGYLGIPKRVRITIVDKPAAPVLFGPNPVHLCASWIGSYNLSAEGVNVRWYSDASLQTLISSQNYVMIPIQNKSYFVTQTINGCESNALIVNTEITTIDATIYFSDGHIRTKETEGDHYSWYKNGIFYKATTKPFIPFDGKTATYVVVITKDGCQAYSEEYISSEENITALEEAPEGWLDVFPNPASTDITLQSKVPNTRVRIYDVLGNLVYEKILQTEKQTIHINGWAKGTYVINMDAGKVAYKKKLMIL